MFGRQSSLFLTAREASCHNTLRWTPFFKCTLASSRRCVANNLFIYSSRPRFSRLVAASWSWKCNSARNEKGLSEECAQNLTFHVEGAKASLWLRRSRKFVLKNVSGSDGFNPRTDFVLGGVRIGMDCMNLVTVISGYTWVSVTLNISAVTVSIQ